MARPLHRNPGMKTIRRHMNLGALKSASARGTRTANRVALRGLRGDVPAVEAAAEETLWARGCDVTNPFNFD